MSLIGATCQLVAGFAPAAGPRLDWRLTCAPDEPAHVTSATSHQHLRPLGRAAPTGGVGATERGCAARPEVYMSASVRWGAGRRGQVVVRRRQDRLRPAARPFAAQLRQANLEWRQRPPRPSQGLGRAREQVGRSETHCWPAPGQLVRAELARSIRARFGAHKGARLGPAGVKQVAPCESPIIIIVSVSKSNKATSASGPLCSLIRAGLGPRAPGRRRRRLPTPISRLARPI